ncbi:hypothetical protein LJC08_01735 [Methanimicrococcus sp. OttesenSCG-928-J09]|nr:hypothetical protein [Methanimicrococcus sp. OttesenSCG-928-J09]
MITQKKQFIFVLVILLAIIALAGSGCLKKDDNSSDETDNDTDSLVFSAKFGTQPIILCGSDPEGENPRFYMYVPAKEVEGNNLVLTFNKTADDISKKVMIRTAI